MFDKQKIVSNFHIIGRKKNRLMKDSSLVCLTASYGSGIMSICFTVVGGKFAICSLNSMAMSNSRWDILGF